MSNLSLINEALVRIGVNPLASFDDLSAQALTASNIYDETRDRCLSEHPWSFALKEEALSKLTEGSYTPNFLQYEHAFQLPVDALRVLGFWDRSRFMIAGDRIYSDSDVADLLYIHRCEAPSWSAPFRKWVVLELAAAFSVSLTDNQQRANFFYQQAWEQRRIARSIDSQQTPSYVFDLMRIYLKTQGNPLGG